MSMLTLDAFALQTGPTSQHLTICGDYGTQEEEEETAEQTDGSAHIIAWIVSSDWEFTTCALVSVNLYLIFMLNISLVLGL